MQKIFFLAVNYSEVFEIESIVQIVEPRFSQKGHDLDLNV